VPSRTDSLSYDEDLETVAEASARAENGEAQTLCDLEQTLQDIRGAAGTPIDAVDRFVPRTEDR